MDTITTSGEIFKADDHARLAWLIFVRFGRNTEAAAEAWRRMLQNDCPDSDYYELVEKGVRLAVEGERQALLTYGRDWSDKIEKVQHELEMAREMAGYEPLDAQERDRKRRLDGIVAGLEKALEAMGVEL